MGSSLIPLLEKNAFQGVKKEKFFLLDALEA